MANMTTVPPLEPASRSGVFGPSPSDSLRETLDDEELDLSSVSMLELRAQLEHERDTARAAGRLAEFETVRTAAPNARDDELLDDPPVGEHHLGRLGGWRATWGTRALVAAVLGTALLVGLGVFAQSTHEQRQRWLHPLPELEATIDPGSPREMTIEDGKMRLGLAREAPSVNLIHLPDRDITLARGYAKAQFKVEVRDGKTVKLVVLTGAIRETLTHPDAVPLLD